MNLEQWYRSLPAVTRAYLTASFAVTLACTFDIVSPLSLYLNFRLVTKKFEARTHAHTHTPTCMHACTRPSLPRPAPPAPMTTARRRKIVAGDAQIWRLLTNFLFFEKFNLNFVFHMHFLHPPPHRQHHGPSSSASAPA